jgi:hypothetical protein
MNLQKLETVEIPLNKLALWDHNVRTSGAEDNLGELIASIRRLAAKPRRQKSFTWNIRHRRWKAPLFGTLSIAGTRPYQTLFPRPLPHSSRRRRPH